MIFCASVSLPRNFRRKFPSFDLRFVFTLSSSLPYIHFCEWMLLDGTQQKLTNYAAVDLRVRFAAKTPKLSRNIRRSSIDFATCILGIKRERNIVL